MKLVRGNPGKRPLNENEPRPPREIPMCPKHIQGEARREWRRMARDLYRLGLLTRIDRAALAVYCQAWGRWVEAEDNVRSKGAIVKVGGTAYPIQNPYLSIANTAIKQLKAFLVEFGMTPSSRSRITTGNGEESTGEEKRFFG